MIWKLYLWLFTSLIAASWIQLGFVELTVHDMIDFPLTALGLLGLFGYAYRRQIGIATIWRVLAVVLLVWNVYYNLHEWPTLRESAKALAVAAPCYVALVLYGYRSRALWSGVER